MKTSESILKITPAFLNAQKKIESVVKDQSNPFFKSKYADLSAVIEACKEKLNAEGIAILQPIDGMTVETILVHTSGEWYSSSTPIVSKEQNNPQALGSAITYAKRYGLQSMVLLPAEDDDGNRASGNDTVASTMQTAVPSTAKVETFYACSQCDDKRVPEAVKSYSMSKWGKIVCYKCQQNLKTGDFNN